MSFTEKMDALDLVITAIKDQCRRCCGHEQKLDKIIERAEGIGKYVTIDQTLVTSLPEGYDLDKLFKRIQEFKTEMESLGVKIKIEANIGP